MKSQWKKIQKTDEFSFSRQDMLSIDTQKTLVDDVVDVDEDEWGSSYGNCYTYRTDRTMNLP